MLNMQAERFKDFLGKALSDPDLSDFAKPGDSFESDTPERFDLTTVYGDVAVRSVFAFVDDRLVVSLVFSREQWGEIGIEVSDVLTAYLDRTGVVTIAKDRNFELEFGLGGPQDQEFAKKLVGNLLAGIEATFVRVTNDF